ncbi:hypothetical protein BMS3Abin09_00998 [bacterium BMS3Abin09]|nr:hypothetical protein BMS3Abin09_00998 [bacterium BMS3Abin09]
MGIEFAAQENRIVEELHIKGYCCFDALDHEFMEGPFHYINSIISVRSMYYQFCDKRIIKDRHIPSSKGSRVDPYSLAAGRNEQGNGSWRWNECLRVLGVYPAFYTVPGKRYLVLLQGHGLSGGDLYLFLYYINAGYHFGDRVFNLDPGIYFHKVKIALIVENEFDRADINIVHCLCGFYCQRAYFISELCIS